MVKKMFIDQITRRKALGLSAIVIPTLSACDWIGSMVGEPTRIGHIFSNQRQYVEKYVRVQGSVSQAISIANRGGFLLADASGTIAVVSKKTVPRVSEVISVRGKIRHLATWASYSALVIEEV